MSRACFKTAFVVLICLASTVATAAVSIVDSVSSVGSTKTLTVSLPATVQADDVIVVQLVLGNSLLSSLPSTPSGWIRFQSTNTLLGATQLLYYRVAQASDAGGSISWTLSSGLFSSNQAYIVGLIVTRGVDTSNPIADHSSSSSLLLGSLSASSVNVLTNGSLLLGFYATGSLGSGFGAEAPMTELYSASQGSLGIETIATYQASVAAGASGSRSVSIGVAVSGDIASLVAVNAEASTIDHYQISHVGTAVTCEPASVTISAHDSSDQWVDASGVTINLSTSSSVDGWVLQSGSGSLSGSSYTFASGEQQVTLGLIKTTSGSVDIDVSDGSATDKDGDVSEDPLLTFSDTAFRFYADGVVDAIGTQIAGKTNSQTLTIKAVGTDTTTGRCTQLINGGSVDIGMGYRCSNPSTCALSNAMTINSTSVPGVSAASSATYQDVILTFDVNGEAQFTMTYADAGQVNVLAQADLDVSGSSVTVSGGSNSFVVRPAGFCVEVTDSGSSCTSSYDQCAVFRRAGDTFTEQVSARTWQSSGESDTDFCDNSTTPNFKTNVTLSHQLLAPSGGELGSLGLGSVSISSSGVASVSQSVSEVGAFQLQADELQDYLGASDADIPASLSNGVGRFVPASFAVLNPQVYEANTAFTYLQQPFTVEYQIEARNQSGDRTYNYRDGFVKLVASDLSYDALDTSGPSVFDESRIQSSSTTITWNQGLADVSTELLVARNGLQAPVTLTLGAKVSDTEGSYTLPTVNPDMDADLDTEDDHKQLGTSVQRFGRLYGQDAWGSEKDALAIPLNIQYWNGSGWQASNGDETSILRTDFSFTSSGGSTQTLTSDPITAPMSGSPQVDFLYDPTGKTTIDFGDGIGGGDGDAGMSVQPPSVTGYFYMDVDLAAYPWLQSDWDQDGDYNDADDTTLPRLEIRFETYRGHDRIIYWREVFN